MFKPTLSRRHALAAVAAIALSAGFPAASIPAAAEPLTKASLRLKWLPQAQFAGFYVAVAKGYYKAEGLDVTIDTAAGSLEPITRVASGTYDMGFGDINSLIKFRDANPATPIKAVFMVYNKPAYAIVARKSLGVTKPKDLEGRKLGAPASCSAPVTP